jgi:hypothetical protein
MDLVLFAVMHHSTNPFHTEVFDMSILSIKKFHPNNKIIVFHTSTSIIPNHMLEYTNVTYQPTQIDGAHVYYAMHMLVKIDEIKTNVENYVLLHDSMVLIKPFNENILNKRFYYLWHFDALYNQYSDQVIPLICNTKFNYKEQCELLNKYNNEGGTTWFGLFGPAFGGKISILKQLWDKLNINDKNLVNYVGKAQIMMAERYISLIASYMNIVDIFPNTISLNGSIENHPYKFLKPDNIYHVNQVLQESYNSYMVKLWLMRQ